MAESGQSHHRPAYTEIVHRAHAAGLAGASVFKGIEGFGRSNHIHTTRLLSLSEDLPVPSSSSTPSSGSGTSSHELDDLDIEGLVILEPVEVVRYAGRPPRGRASRDPADGARWAASSVHRCAT